MGLFDFFKRQSAPVPSGKLPESLLTKPTSELSPTQSANLRPTQYCRPAAVLVIDLVKHSIRTKEDIEWIQQTLHESLESALAALELKEVQLKYTGDGYICSFVGDASVRVVDFINTTIPDLQRKLSARQQQFRAGLDFGLVHLHDNRLTGSQEHFDEPGIRAARLEHAAQANQILTTETVYNIFSPYYKANFPGQRLGVETKDRLLPAYELVPHDYTAIRRAVFEYLYGRFASASKPRANEPACRILIVEDNEDIRRSLGRRLEKHLGANIVFATDGEDGLRQFGPDKFEVVLADVLMPILEGDEMAVRMLVADPRIVIFLVTACTDDKAIARFEKKVLDNGGFGYFSKPFDFKELVREILAALSPTIADCFRRLSVLSRNPGSLKNKLRQISVEVSGVFTIAESEADLVASLIRHKVKHLISEFLESVRPGEDLLARADEVRSHLAFLRRVAETSHNAKGQTFDAFLGCYVADLRKEHEQLNIEVRIDGPSAKALVGFTFEKLLLLSVCELIDNAVYALAGSGKIGIDVAFLPSKQRLRVAVSDSGPRIPKEIAQRFFELGFSTKGPGRGYGLHLVQESVQKMQGEVTYVSESDKGNRFTMHAPIPAANVDD